MKTTIDLSNSLFKEIKRMTVKNNRTFKELVEAALSLFIEQQKKQKKPFRLQKKSFAGKGIAPGLNEGDWSQIRSLIYQGHGE